MIRGEAINCLHSCTTLYIYSDKNIPLPLEKKRYYKSIKIALPITFVFVIIVNIHIVSASPLTTMLLNKVQENYYFVTEWGSEGMGNGQFLRPHDLEFDKEEKYLYAVDRDGNRIQVFDKNGTFLFKFGQKGNGDGQFLVPYGIDVDIAGNVWVADRGNHRIEKFDSQGNFILKFGNASPHPSDAPGKFDNPRHLEVDKNLRYVYVADSKNNRIQQFDINGKFYAFDERCGHMNARLSNANINQNIVTCPFHVAIFNITTGEGLGENRS